MQACMKWVCSFKALHQTLVRVYVKVRNGDYNQLHANMAKYYIRLLVCDVCVGSKALSFWSIHCLCGVFVCVCVCVCECVV